jgi:hypothetical protein
MGIHLAHALGEGIDVFLQDPAGLGDLRLLSGELARPFGRLEPGLASGTALAHFMTEEIRAAEQCQRRDCRGRKGDGVRKVDVTRTPLATTEENDVHAEHSRKLDSIAIDRLSVTGSGPRRTTATDEMLCKKHFITGNPAVIAHALDRWLCVLTFQ